MAVVGGEYSISWFYVKLTRLRLAGIHIVRLLWQTPIFRRKKLSMSASIKRPALPKLEVLKRFELSGTVEDRGEEAKGRTRRNPKHLCCKVTNVM